MVIPGRQGGGRDWDDDSTQNKYISAFKNITTAKRHKPPLLLTFSALSIERQIQIHKYGNIQIHIVCSSALFLTIHISNLYLSFYLAPIIWFVFVFVLCICIYVIGNGFANCRGIYADNPHFWLQSLFYRRHLLTGPIIPGFSPLYDKTASSDNSIAFWWF